MSEITHEFIQEDRGEILVVDDSLSSLRLLSSILRQAGYRVREAASGPLALWTIGTRLPDLILLDVRMPGMDGFEVCRRLKANLTSARVPVIFLSAQDETTDKVQGLGLGAVDFVNKSSAHEEILARIDTHITLARVKLALEMERATLEERVSERTAELLRGKSLLRSVIDSGPDFIYALDLEGGVLLVNKNMDKAIGSGSVSNLLSQDDQQVFAGETVYRASERMSLADGVQGVFETYKTPLRDSNGTIYGLLCYHREITERLRLEDERRALEKELGQARKMEAVGQLAGGIAHDFNNQLSLILGFAQLATRALANGKLDKLDDYLMEIFKAGSAAQAVVAQLLAFSRNDTAATTVLDLAPVVKETVAALSIVVGASFEFKIEIESGLPAILIGAVQVRQLLTNLVLNARDASLGAGAITVQLQRVQEAGRVVCSSCRKVLTGEFIELSVSDKGSGISADILERIFDPFFTTKDVGKGSGLGLSMVHGITHSAAGHVGVVSVPGQGTKISSYFPVGMP